MKKLLLITAFIAGLSSAARAQTEEPAALDFDTCTGVMSADDMVNEARRLSQSLYEQERFFAANCAMIASYKGNPEAQLMLARFYRDGIGVPQSNVFAYKWGHIAAAAGKDEGLAIAGKVESSLSTDDLLRAKNEVQAFSEFTQRADGRIDELKKFLMDENISGLTPEQMERIVQIKTDITNLFNVDDNNINNHDDIVANFGRDRTSDTSGAPSSPPRAFTPPPVSDNIQMEPPAPPVHEPFPTPHMPIMSDHPQMQYPVPNQEHMAVPGEVIPLPVQGQIQPAASGESKASGRRKPDFFNDPYNKK